MNLVPCCCHQARSFPATHDISAGAFQRWPPEKTSVSPDANCKVIDTVTPGQLGVSKNRGAPKAWVSVLNDHKWPLLNDFGVPFLLRNNQQTNLTFPLHHLPCALHLWATGSAQDSQAPQRHLRSARGVRPTFLPHRPEGWVTQLATSGNCWAVGLWSFAKARQIAENPKYWTGLNSRGLSWTKGHISKHPQTICISVLSLTKTTMALSRGVQMEDPHAPGKIWTHAKIHCASALGLVRRTPELWSPTWPCIISGKENCVLQCLLTDLTTTRLSCAKVIQSVV